MSKKLKPLNLRQMLANVGKQENKSSLIKTAVTSGWLTNGEFYTKLSDEDVEKIKEVYNADADAKKSEPLSISLPKQVGFIVDETKHHGNKISVIAGDQEVEVDASAFVTLQKRHPKANLFLANNPQNDGIIFSEKSTVALLRPFQEKKVEEKKSRSKKKTEKKETESVA